MRQRLTPQERIPQILDTAMAEFAMHGYEATRIDDIAARAGLSKGGIYAHFRSKKDIFMALLEGRMAKPAWDTDALLARVRSTRELVQSLIDVLYAPLFESHVATMTRLLIAEARHVPDLAEHWHARHMEATQTQLAETLRRATELGLCRHSVVIDQPWLLLAPLVSYVVRQATFTILTEDIVISKQMHIEMLLELLGPQESIGNTE